MTSSRWARVEQKQRLPTLHLCACLTAALVAAPGPSGEQNARVWPVFHEVSALWQVQFEHRASPTSEKYLLETMGSGVAVFDANGDGLLDLYFVNGARLDVAGPRGSVPEKPSKEYWNRLFVQREGHEFVDMTEEAGVAGRHYGMGAAVADYDNDGDQDLYVTAFPRNQLYRNDGKGTFTDVTDAAGVAASGWSSSASFVDVDHDGRLDLLVARYLDWTLNTNPWCGEKAPLRRAYCHPDLFPGIAPVLFRNDGGGRFTDITAAAGLADLPAKALGVAIADYDADGLVDLVIANDSIRQYLYRNTGGGRFAERALLAGAAVDEDGRVYAGMGVDVADYDNDGRPDAVITNLSNQMYALYRNEGQGTFVYTTHRTGLGRLTTLFSGWGARFMDLDNDGWKDLFIAQGHVLDTIAFTSPHISYKQRALVARNDAGRRFVDMTDASGRALAERWAGRGLATGDLDNDGDADVVVTTTNGPAYVLRNDGGNRGSWLSLRLEGTRSNRDGIGASVRVASASGLEQWFTVTTSSSYLSASDRSLHVGLGEDSRVRLIDVTWPSGRSQQLRDVAARQHLVIREGPK